MTILAYICRARVLRILTGCNRTVVATETVTGDIGVVIRGGQPGDSGVAVITIISTRNVVRVLTGCDSAVVAGTATTQYLCVIYGERWQPDGRRVAVFANIGCKRMSWRLASRGYAIMAITAIAGDICVIEIGRQPASRRVAVLTHITAGDVRRRLAGCGHAVVTAYAIADDANVVEVCGHPACGRMTVIARVAAGDVRGRLARGNRTVVAGSTGTNDLSMIDSRRRSKSDHGVAVLAHIAGVDVVRVLTGRVVAVVAAHTVAGNVDVIEIGRHPAG